MIRNKTIIKIFGLSLLIKKQLTPEQTCYTHVNFFSIKIDETYLFFIFSIEY